MSFEYVELLRHGRTRTPGIFRGQLDDPLSPEGYDQMAASVEGHEWSSIVTSPLSRCRDFARELAGEQGIGVTVDERLMEYHFGEWEGKLFEEVMESDEDSVRKFFQDPYSFTPPGAEDYRDFKRRVLAAWSSLSRDASPVDHDVEDSPDQDGNRLIVTHGGVIYCILASMLRMKKVYHHIDLPYACISRISPARGELPRRLLFHGVGPVRSN